MLQTIKNIYRLGVKELWGLLRDPLMLGLIVYTFSIGVYMASTAKPNSISNATIAIVDEDNSQISNRIREAFLSPYFMKPVLISRNEIDDAMDKGRFTFTLVIPNNFQHNLLSNTHPEIMLNVDATRMSQAFTGGGYIQEIIQSELQKFLKIKTTGRIQTELARTIIRNRYNPNLTRAWFESVMQMINYITMLAVVLTGAALIREREHGTLEHLLVMPVTAFEIMVSKIWAMALIVLIASLGSLIFVVNWILHVPLEGSLLLFLVGAALHLFAITSMGIFLACIVQNMPQIGMLIFLLLIPMIMLSGGSTPLENMPKYIVFIMHGAPTTHFVKLSVRILFRGGGLEEVWSSFLSLAIIGALFFSFALARFKKTVMQ